MMWQLSMNRVLYRILSLGGEQDGSKMVVAHESMLMLYACVPTRGVWGHAPQKNFEFRSYQIASDAIWDKIVV